jgi:hypothetical protein
MVRKVLIAVLILLGPALAVLAQDGDKPTTAAPWEKYQTQSSPSAVPYNGRYQIVQSPITARDTFLLDTQSGTVWQLTVMSSLKGEPAVWNIMRRIDNDADYAAVVGEYGRKTSPTSESVELARNAYSTATSVSKAALSTRLVSYSSPDSLSRTLFCKATPTLIGVSGRPTRGSALSTASKRRFRRPLQRYRSRAQHGSCERGTTYRQPFHRFLPAS